MEKGGGGCRIPKLKIKIPKGHYCKECGKSGKALGGHMSSAHANSSKIKIKKNKKSGHEYSSSSTCMLQSQKSLFGHMRCHPERELGFLPTSKSGLNSDHTKDSFAAALELIKMLKHDHQTKSNHHHARVFGCDHRLLVAARRRRRLL